MRLILEEQQKYLQSFINNAAYRPMNPDTDVTYQAVNVFSSAQHCLYNSGKDRCIRYMWSNNMFVVWNPILLFFMKIENTVYTSFQNSMLLFINGFTFDIMNIQNNISQYKSLLNLNEYQC